MIEKKEILEKLNIYLEEKGISKTNDDISNEEKLRRYGIKSLESTKGILQDLQSYSPPSGDSLTRKIKNKIIGLIRNVSISTIELLVIRQNKFNELTYQFIDMLQKENSELRSRIEKLEKEKNQ